MNDPITRVLTVLEILQTKDRIAGAELAERLQVDLRTVQRYIARLKELGIPIEASSGVGGAYRLRAGFRLPPLLFTNEEAFALSLGLLALRQVGLEAFAPATEGALAKLERVLPAAVRDSVATVEQAIALEPSAWMVPTPVDSLICAASAVRQCCRLRFAYTSHAGHTSRREIEPYAVLHADDRWYLIGNCLDRQALRTFRLDRVVELERRSETFLRVEGFDAKRYMAERLPFIQSQHQIDVWLDMTAQEATASFALWRVAFEEENGGIRLRCGRDKLELFAAMLLSTNRRIVVHQPEALRAVFRRLAVLAERAASGVAEFTNLSEACQA